MFEGIGIGVSLHTSLITIKPDMGNMVTFRQITHYIITIKAYMDNMITIKQYMDNMIRIKLYMSNLSVWNLHILMVCVVLEGIIFAHIYCP